MTNMAGDEKSQRTHNLCVLNHLYGNMLYGIAYSLCDIATHSQRKKPNTKQSYSDLPTPSPQTFTSEISAHRYWIFIEKIQDSSLHRDVCQNYKFYQFRHRMIPFPTFIFSP